MTAKPASETTLLAGGDVALNRPVSRGAFGSLTPLFKNTGVAFTNLELPLSRRGRPASEKILLRGTPEMMDALREAEFDVVSLANNHILDYGEEALFDTLAILDDHDIPYAGAGENLTAARRAIVLERGGLRIGILAHCSVIPRGFAAESRKPGVNPLRAFTSYRTTRDLSEYPGTPPQILTWAAPEDLRKMKGDIRRLKKKTDLVLVNHHWGTSMTHDIQGFQREIAYAAIDAGADLVMGGHPHVLQGIEYYKGIPIVYSMGNLIFDFAVSFFTEATRQTFLFGCELTKNGVKEPYLIPCKSGDLSKPSILSPQRGEGKRISAFIGELCEPLGTHMNVQGERILIKPGSKPAPKRTSYTSL